MGSNSSLSVLPSDIKLEILRATAASRPSAILVLVACTNSEFHTLFVSYHRQLQQLALSRLFGRKFHLPLVVALLARALVYEARRDICHGRALEEDEIVEGVDDQANIAIKQPLSMNQILRAMSCITTGDLQLLPGDIIATIRVKATIRRASTYRDYTVPFDVGSFVYWTVMRFTMTRWILKPDAMHAHSARQKRELSRLLALNDRVSSSDIECQYLLNRVERDLDAVEPWEFTPCKCRYVKIHDTREFGKLLSPNLLFCWAVLGRGALDEEQISEVTEAIDTLNRRRRVTFHGAPAQDWQDWLDDTDECERDMDSEEGDDETEAKGENTDEIQEGEGATDVA